MNFGSFMASNVNSPSSSSNFHATGVDPVEDPLYIHLSDSPSLVLVQPLLDGNNYHGWSRTFRRALESKNKTGFVTGAVIKPDEGNRRYAAWSKANNMVASWIVNSVIPSIGQSVMWFDNAIDIWNDLKHRYGNADAFRLSDLQEQFYATKQGECSVTDYYTKLKVLWEELMVLRSIPSCVCNRCTCNVSNQIHKFVQENYVIKFIKGLNEEFEHVKSQVLLSIPLPDLKTTFAMAVKLERKLNYSGMQNQINNSPTMVMNVSGVNRAGNFLPRPGGFTGSGQGWQRPAGRGFKKDFSRSVQGNSRAPVCTHCNMIGHTVDRCYKKYGYPLAISQEVRQTVLMLIQWLNRSLWNMKMLSMMEVRPLIMAMGRELTQSHRLFPCLHMSNICN